jgi:uncharacterized damage-inducible protein DinB
MNEADREILECFTRTRHRTMELVRQTPTEWLSRRADGEHHPLGWLYMHIAEGVDWWLQYCMKHGQRVRWKPADEQNPAAILAAMEASMKKLVEFFEADDGARMGQAFDLDLRTLPTPEDGPVQHYVGRNRVLYLTAHEIHHRGKIVLALRQWGMNQIPALPF